MIGTEIKVSGRQFTINQEIATGKLTMADLQSRGFSGRQFIATGKRGAVKLIAESKTGTFHIIGG